MEALLYYMFSFIKLQISCDCLNNNNNYNNSVFFSGNRYRLNAVEPIVSSSHAEPSQTIFFYLTTTIITDLAHTYVPTTPFTSIGCSTLYAYCADQQVNHKSDIFSRGFSANVYPYLTRTLTLSRLCVETIRK